LATALPARPRMKGMETRPSVCIHSRTLSQFMGSVALQVTGTLPVSTLAANPAVMEGGETVRLLGEMTTHETTGPGPAMEADFPQAQSAPVRVNAIASFINAKRTDSLNLNVMALPSGAQ